jgi:hypothetical protein
MGETAPCGGRWAGVAMLGRVGWFLGGKFE